MSKYKTEDKNMNFSEKNVIKAVEDTGYNLVAVDKYHGRNVLESVKAEAGKKKLKIDIYLVDENKEQHIQIYAIKETEDK